jgi:SAM-dependent methyltransferase
MRDRSDEDWQELGAREPYFAVLTESRFLREHLTDDARTAFFASGEADVSALLALLPTDFAPRSALDFGCGVGRLTRALARRIERVHGVDVAPAMLDLARANVPSATFSAALPDGEFDFICSLLVFQHMPVARGLATLRSLIARLAPGGFAAVQFTFRRPGGPLRRLARSLRARLPWLHRALGARLPYMQMNEYDREELRRVIVEAGGTEPRFHDRVYEGIDGAIAVFGVRSRLSLTRAFRTTARPPV